MALDDHLAATVIVSILNEVMEVGEYEVFCSIW